MDADKENIAVDTVSLTLASSGNFKPNINKNDKLPSWDGEIYVYLSKKKEKQGLYDVIPVQVKGTARDSRVAGGFKYSVQIADLKNFLECRSGTTLYFVVFIHEEDDEPKCEIYYEKFLPFDLKHILKECGNQDTVTITFKIFPKKKKERARLIYDIVRDMKRQRACINADIVALEPIFKETPNPVLSLEHIIYQEEDMQSPFPFLGRDYYLYAKRQDNIHQPVLHGRIEGFGIPMYCPVIINDTEYFSMYERVEYVDRIVIKIGNAIEFVLPKTEKPAMTLHIHLTWKLSEDIRDVSFILDLIKYKQIKLNGAILPCELDQSSKPEIDIEALNQHLETCQMIQTLMNAIDVTRDLDLSQVKDEQRKGLQKLYSFIVDGKKARIEFQADYDILELEIGNLKILLFVVADKRAKQCYEIRNFNNIHNVVTTNDGFQTSPYVCLSEEQLMRADNIKYENFFRQLETLPLSERHVKAVTLLLYKMLHAYDKSGDIRSDILSAAIRIAEWLETHDQYSDLIKTINKMEAIKRSRSLNEQENDVLFAIAENTKLEPVYRSFAYLLLDEYKSAIRFFEQIPHEKQEELKQYPISRFWPEDI